MKKHTLKAAVVGALVFTHSWEANAATWQANWTGTQKWNLATNWNGGVPNATSHIASFGNPTGQAANSTLTVDLDNNVTVGQLLVRAGASATWNSGLPIFKIGTEGEAHTITMQSQTGGAIIQHSGGVNDIINAKVIAAGELNLQTVNTWTNGTYHGILTFEGGMKINENVVVSRIQTGDGEFRINGLEMGKNSVLNKNSGNMYISGMRNNIEGGIFSTVSSTRLFNRDASTASHWNFLVPNGVSGPQVGLSVSNGNLYLGLGATMPGPNAAPGSVVNTVSNFYIGSRIVQTGGDLMFGHNSTNTTGHANVTFYGNNLRKGGGTFRMQYGNGPGTTTVLGGNTVNGKGTLTSASTTISNYSHLYGTALHEGMRVFGEGIAANTYITAISGSNITLSSAATVTNSGHALFFAEGNWGKLTAAGAVTNSNTVTVNTTAGLAVGQTLTSGSGILAGTRITGISGNTVTVDAPITVANGTALRAFAPGTLTFGEGMVSGTGGSVTQFMHSQSSANDGRGTINIDPSMNLRLVNRASVNMTDSQGTIQNWTFNSIGSDSRVDEPNVLMNVNVREGDPFISLPGGYTNLTTGSVITVRSGDNTHTGRVLGIYANNILLDNAPSWSASGSSVRAEVQQYSQIIIGSNRSKIIVGNNSSTNDYVDSQFAFGGSAQDGNAAGNSARLVKVGTNTLTLAGHQDNGTFRVEVQQGTVVLAKESNAYVHAIGAQLIVGDADAAIERVVIGGSNWDGNTGFASNFNDQIYGTARVLVNPTGFFDLNGFYEGIGYLYGSNNTSGGVVGNSSSTTATLLIGERWLSDNPDGGNYPFWGGNIRDGGMAADGSATAGGKVNLVKGMGNTFFVTNTNTYSGYTNSAMGTIELREAGRLTNTSHILVNQGVFYLNNTIGGVAGNLGDRVNDNAQVILRQGVLNFRGNASLASSETFGDLTSRAYNIARVIHSTAANAPVHTVTFNSYQYDFGSSIAFVEELHNLGANESTGAINLNGGVGLAGAFRRDFSIYGAGLTEINASTIAQNAASAKSQFILKEAPDADTLVGGARVDNLNGTSPYAFTRKDVPILLGAFGGHGGNATRDFMTVETINGVHYIRPFEEREYYDLTGTSHSFENAESTRKNVLLLRTNGALFSANAAYNSLRMQGDTRVDIASGSVLKIGDGDSVLGYDPTGHAGAGMVVGSNHGTMIGGQGTLDFGERVATFRLSGSMGITADIAVNNQERNAEGNLVSLVKTGGNNYLELWGKGLFSGETHVYQGSMRVMNNLALGRGGADSNVYLNASAQLDEGVLSFGNGVTLGSVTNADQKTNVFLEYEGRITVLDQHSVISGNLLNASNSQAGNTHNGILRSRRNSGILTVKGVTAGYHKESAPLGSPTYQVSPTMPGIGANTGGYTTWAMADGKSASMINFEGGLADLYVDGVAQAAQEDRNKHHLLVRGNTGPNTRLTPAYDFHVNIGDSPHATGIIDYRSSAIVRLQGNYGIANDSMAVNRGMTGTMVMRFRTEDAGANNETPNLLKVLSMHNPAGAKNQYRQGLNFLPDSQATRYNTSQITWGDGYSQSDNGYSPHSPTSYGMLANEGYGKTIIGNYYGSIDTNARPKIAYGLSSEYLYEAEGTYDEQGNYTPGEPLDAQTNRTLITLSGGRYTSANGMDDLKVGMQVEGTGFQVGTTITAINRTSGNAVITLSQAATVTNGMVIDFKSVQTIQVQGGARHTEPSLPTRNNLILFTGSTFGGGMSVENLRPGMAVTGSLVSGSVPVNTYIVQVYGKSDAYPNGAVMLNNALGANPNSLVFNDSTTSTASTQQYSDIRAYAAAGGELDIRLRLYDDGSWGIDNEAGAITKVGRGDVRLSGAHTANGELDGGVNLHGGRLILDYTKHDGRKITSADNYQTPITLAGGEMWMIGNGALSQQYVEYDPDTSLPIDGSLVGVNTMEQIRGLMFVRPGSSTIRVTSAGNSTTRLDLGLPNNTTTQLAVLPIINSGGTMNFWKDEDAGGAAFISMNVQGPVQGIPLPQILWADSTGRMTDFTVVGVASANQSKPLFSALASDTFNTFSNGWGDATSAALVDPLQGLYYGNFQEGSYGPVSGDVANHTAFRNLILNQGVTEGTPASVSTLEGTMWFLSNDPVFADNTRFAEGGAHDRGGSLLVTHQIGNTNKVFTGGADAAISSLMVAERYVADNTKPQFEEYNFYLHNHANPYDFANPNAEGTGGLVVMDVDITDPNKISDPKAYRTVPDPWGWGPDSFEAEAMTRLKDYRMNFVNSGTGTTMMYRARDGASGYGYTGSTFFNGGTIYEYSDNMMSQVSPNLRFRDLAIWTPGTVWASDPNKLGATPTSYEAENLYFNGGRLRLGNMYELQSNGLVDHSKVIDDISNDTITLHANRGIMIGGQGAWIDVVHAGTTFVINNEINTEIHSPTFSQGVYRNSNLGMGDLTKEGAGTLVLSSKSSDYSGLTHVVAGTLQVNIGQPSTEASDNTVITRIQDNLRKNAEGVLGSNFTFIDGTQVEAGAELRFQIIGNSTNDTLGNRYQNSSSEWITLDGGTLGTTEAHTGGALQGMIRVRDHSFIDIVGAGKVLRFNSEEGMMVSEGIINGGLTKMGAGTLELWENNASFKGNWDIKDGQVLGLGQGKSFGVGTNLTIGSEAEGKTGSAEALMGSRHRHTWKMDGVTASANNATFTIPGGGHGQFADIPLGTTFTASGSVANLVFTVTQVNQDNAMLTSTKFMGTSGTNKTLTFTETMERPLEYTMHQDIDVRPHATGGVQRRVIGAANSQSLGATGSNWDKYRYTGDITFGDPGIAEDPESGVGADLYVTYRDSATSAAIARGVANLARFDDGRLQAWNQVISLEGQFIGKGSLRTTVQMAGGSNTTNHEDVRVYFEMNGTNAGWTGAIHTGNGANADRDNDAMHIVRWGTLDGSKAALATNAMNDVFMSSNSILQMGGKDVTIGNLRIGTLDSGKGIEDFVALTDVDNNRAVSAGHNGQTIVIENASNEAGSITIFQEEDADWNVRFQDGSTDPTYVTDVNLRTEEARNNSLSVVKHGGFLYGPDADWSGEQKGTAVMTQVNTYTGSTEVRQGNLQVGRGGVGTTGHGATTVFENAAISGTGMIEGAVTGPRTTHALRGIMRPGDLGGSAKGTLTVKGNLEASGTNSNFSFNLGSTSTNATRNAADLAGIGVNVGDLNFMAGAAYEAALTSIATAWGSAEKKSAGDHDQIKILGNFSLSGDTTVQVIDEMGAVYSQGDVYNLFDWETIALTSFDTGGNVIKGGAIDAGSTKDLLLPLLSGDLFWDTSRFLTHGMLVIVAVPEPSKGLLIFVAAGALLMRRRRR